MAERQRMGEIEPTDIVGDTVVGAERMRLIERQLTDKIAGTDEFKATAVAEWTCPECDYFDEADDTDG